jgi:hypothetical protein
MNLIFHWPQVAYICLSVCSILSSIVTKQLKQFSAGLMFVASIVYCLLWYVIVAGGFFQGLVPTGIVTLNWPQITLLCVTVIGMFSTLHDVSQGEKSVLGFTYSFGMTIVYYTLLYQGGFFGGAQP